MKDVRQSIHDAIDQINQNVNEALDLAQIKFGTDITSPTSPVGDYIEGTVYFNMATGIIWRLNGGSWNQLGSMKSIEDISRTGTSGLTDTYTITYNDGTTKDYNVTNGEKGVSVTNVTKKSSEGNVDHYEVNLSDGTTTPNSIDVTNGVSITDISLVSTVGNVKNYDINLSNGTKTPTGFSVVDGTSSYVYIRFSANFDGSGMVSVPTDQTVYIGIVVTTQSTAPTDPAVYSWVRFIGKSGTGTGDMLKAEYSTKYNGVVDKAAALFDGENEIDASELLSKTKYASKGIEGTVDKATELVDTKNNKVADTEVLAAFSDDGEGIKYKGEEISGKSDNDTIVKNENNELMVSEEITNQISKNTTKLSDSKDWLKSKNLVSGIESGNIRTNGEEYDDNIRVRCEDFIEVEPNTTYTVNCVGNGFVPEVALSYFDNILTERTFTSGFQSIPYTFTTGNNTKYVRFLLRNVDNSVVSENSFNSVQLEKGSSATTYQPFSKSNSQITKELSDSADWLKGKNLLSLDMLTNGEIDADGSVSVNAGGVKSEFISVKPNTVYTASCSKSARRIFICEYDSNNNANRKVSDLEQTSFSITTASTTVKVRIEYAGNGTNGSIQTDTIASFNPMFCEGTDTNYEPYTKSNVKLTNVVDGALQSGSISYNLLDCSKLTELANFTPHFVDGQCDYITLHGATTALQYMLISFKPKAGEKYIISGLNGGSVSTYSVRVRNSAITTEYAILTDGEVEFTAPSDEELKVMIRIEANVNINSVKFYPMIRKANIKSKEFVLYSLSNVELTKRVKKDPTVTKITFSSGSSTDADNCTIVDYGNYCIVNVSAYSASGNAGIITTLPRNALVKSFCKVLYSAYSMTTVYVDKDSNELKFKDYSMSNASFSMIIPLVAE